MLAEVLPEQPSLIDAQAPLALESADVAVAVDAVDAADAGAPAEPPLSAPADPLPAADAAPMEPQT